MAMVTNTEQIYNYHYNAIGSTIAMTDMNQAVVNKYSYDVFGNIENQSETVQQPFKFVGQFGVMTEPNGLYYMRARYYDPNVGRFISEDPIGFEGEDVNLYAYVGGNPVLLIDPSGLEMAGLPNFVNPGAHPNLGGLLNILNGFGKAKLGIDAMNKASDAIFREQQKLDYGTSKDMYIIYGTNPIRFVGIVNIGDNILKTPDSKLVPTTVEGIRGLPTLRTGGCYK